MIRLLLVHSQALYRLSYGHSVSGQIRTDILLGKSQRLDQLSYRDKYLRSDSNGHNSS